MLGAMGLCISVGIVADLLENDPESAELIREDFKTVNEALGKRLLPLHHEPEGLPKLDDRTPVIGFPYSCLHVLRRIYAHHLAYPGKPLPEDIYTSKDNALVERETSEFLHLLAHSDCEGFYVPVDFPEVIFDDRLPGAMLGSSQRILGELQDVAPLLGITLSDGTLSDQEAQRLTQIVLANAATGTALMVWLALFEAARLSIAHKTAIHFG
jgi:hypothetical protein